ncbi:MAG: class I SAM-dependent methyltransferase, partial [Deltaproteobacteria bacterium]|nr:class I SAM-dependent methyltransferase [Deltaproteobacteria bacterium]
TGKDKITLEFWLDHDDLGEVNDPAYIVPFSANPVPEVDFEGVPIPVRLDERLLSYFPRAQATGALMLDLGCGACLHRQVCEQAGFTHVGLDLRAPEAPLWGDAHVLPFADNSFEFILSIAVLEHLRYPFLGLREAWRVLKPGGRLVGTVAFLEPFHDSSYYHHTHLGLHNALRSSGFEIKVFGPNADWLALRALAEMILFPKLPLVLSRVLVKPLDWLHRLWWQLGERVTKFRGAQESIRLTSTAGSFSFVVEKPKEAEK